MKNSEKEVMTEAINSYIAILNSDIVNIRYPYQKNCNWLLTGKRDVAYNIAKKYDLSIYEENRKSEIA